MLRPNKKFSFIKMVCVWKLAFVQAFSCKTILCSLPGRPAKNTGISDAQIDFLKSYGFQLFEANEKHFR